MRKRELLHLTSLFPRNEKECVNWIEISNRFHSPAPPYHKAVCILIISISALIIHSMVLHSVQIHRRKRRHHHDANLPISRHSALRTENWAGIFRLLILITAMLPTVMCHGVPWHMTAAPPVMLHVSIDPLCPYRISTATWVLRGTYTLPSPPFRVIFDM